MTARAPSGDERLVNTYTTAYQRNPAIAVHDQGFVVVWDSQGSFGTDNDQRSIQARLYSQESDPIGDQFQVNTLTTFLQFSPAVAANADGRFAVTWTHRPLQFGDLATKMQLFESSGAPSGSEIDVTDPGLGSSFVYEVGAFNGGDFVVVFGRDQNIGIGEYQRSQLFLRRFSSTGNPVGGDVQVTSGTSLDHTQAALATLPGGDAVLVWKSDLFLTGPENSSVRGQKLSPSGVPVGQTFQVNSWTSSYVSDPKVALDGEGGFVVVWSSTSSPGTDTGYTDSILGRRFASDGSPLGDDFQVNQMTDGSQSSPAIASLEEGGFQVVWSSPSDGSDELERSIVGRRLSAEGVFLGGDGAVNQTTSGEHAFPQVVPQAGGGFVAVWQRDAMPQGPMEQDIFLRPVSPPDLFSDGFESGDASAWSHVFP